MMTLRCTQRLLTRLPATTGAESTAPTTLLGDWYAAPLFIGPARLVLCASERSLLPVILPLKPAVSLPDRLPDALVETLQALGIPDAVIDRERAAMTPCQVGRTTNRAVLGTVVDLVWHARAIIADGGTLDLPTLRFHLWEMPCSILKYDVPGRRTRDLLGAA
jgi:hypothetical protein